MKGCKEASIVCTVDSYVDDFSVLHGSQESLNFVSSRQVALQQRGSVHPGAFLTAMLEAMKGCKGSFAVCTSDPHNDD